MLDSISSLAAQLLEVGEAEEARQLHRRMLKPRQRALGPEHARGNADSTVVLASALGTASKHDEAAAHAASKGPGLTGWPAEKTTIYSFEEHEMAKTLLERVVEVRQRVLGPEHPTTLETPYY